jgi:nitrite reductase (NADH) small subunit
MSLAKWVRLCAAGEAPQPGKVMEGEVEGVAVCLANVRGELSALDNRCPHRDGPLGQGWIEGDTVICPWHSWAFHVKTGLSEYPADEQVTVFPVRVDGNDVLVEMTQEPGTRTSSI